MFNRKEKIIKQQEEKILSLELLCNTKDDSISSLTLKLQDLMSANNILKQNNDSLKNKYQKYIENDNEYQNEKRQYEELIQQKIKLKTKYKQGLSIYNELNKEIKIYQDTIEIGSFGLYEPIFNYDDSNTYIDEIKKNYEKQKELILDDKAITCNTEWMVNNSKIAGHKMTKKHKKLWLLAFNGECDSIITKVKWNNIEKSKERIIKTYEKLNQLGTIDSLEIQKEFLDLKIEELELNYEYQLRRHKEKEEQKRIREQIREEEKALRDYEKAEKEAEEEEKYLQKAIERVKQRFGFVTPDEFEELNVKIKELEIQLQEAQEKKERAISLAQTTKVGYIYVISNIGSLGEDIYKIGMTRRLDPQDRVDELSNASVPFRFDVHAVIFSENAPQLEYDLHQKFNDKRINKVNRRKEFFKVKLVEIEEFVNEHADAKIEFTKIAEAREYRETMNVIEAIKSVSENKELESKYPESLFE